MKCGVLMGANIANEIAAGQLAEASLAFNDVSADTHHLLCTLLSGPNFVVSAVRGVEATELCGALKNIVAVAVGLAAGNGYGFNTQASIIRLGFEDMRNFIRRFYGSVDERLFLSSCGIGDLIATCFGGRNQRCSKAYAERGGKSTFEDIEKELLNGQRLQGPETASEVNAIIVSNGLEGKFPLFELVFRVCHTTFDVTNMKAELTKAFEDARYISGIPKM